MWPECQAWHALMEELIFKSDRAFLETLWTKSQESLRLLCPVCGGEVMFAPDWKRARELTVHPGAYCTVNRRHLTVVFEEAPVERSRPPRDS